MTRHIAGASTREEHDRWVVAQLADIDEMLASGRIDMGRLMLAQFKNELEELIEKKWPA